MVDNATLALFEAQFEKAVQVKVEAERKDDVIKIAEAEKAAKDARDAVEAVKSHDAEIEVATGGGNLHRMSDGKLIQTKRGILHNKNERGAREDKDGHINGRERTRPTRSRARQRVGYAEGRG